MATTPARRRRKSRPDSYVAARPGSDELPAVTPSMLLERIFDFLKRRGWLAVPIALLAGILASAAAWHAMPLEYTAERVITIAPPGNIDFGRFKASEISDLTSLAVAKVAVSLPEASAMPMIQHSADPAADLVLRVRWESEPEDQNIKVTISDVDPKVAQTLANAVVEGYLRNAEMKNGQKLRGDLEAARKERQEAIESTQRIQEELRLLAEKADHGDPESVRKTVEVLQREYYAKQNEREKTKIECVRLKKDLEYLQSAPLTVTAEDEERIRSRALVDQNKVQALSRMEAEANLIAQQSNLGQADEEYLRRRRFIDREKEKLDEETRTIRERLLEDKRKLRESEKARAQKQLDAMEENERLLDATLLELNNRVGNLEEASLKMRRFEPDLETLAAKKEKADVRIAELTRAAQETHVSSITPADEPKIPKSSSKRLLAIFGGGVGAFFLVLSLFGYADFNMNIVTRPEHLERTQPLPVLGVLPRLPEGKRLPTDNDFLAGARRRGTWMAMNEAINSLRITLTFAPDRHNDGMSALMVTSPRDAEGKSTFAAHLAISLARTGVRVVLVEADMHRPTQSETFGVPREPGFAEVLKQLQPLDAVIRATDYPNLFVLPAGGPVDERNPALLPDRVAEVFSELRSRFQTVIVDAPPVLPVYDAMVLGQHVDETVLMVRCDHSRFQTIDQSRHRLESVGVSIAGLVVTSTSMASRYGYYYESEGYAGARGRVASNGTPTKINGSEPLPHSSRLTS